MQTIKYSIHDTDVLYVFYINNETEYKLKRLFSDPEHTH